MREGFLTVSALPLWLQSLSFGTAIYFTIVTMATVGYGDIGVSSDLARLVICLVILTSLIWLPLEINKLTQVPYSGLPRLSNSYNPRGRDPCRTCETLCSV